MLSISMKILVEIIKSIDSEYGITHNYILPPQDFCKVLENMPINRNMNINTAHSAKTYAAENVDKKHRPQKRETAGNEQADKPVGEDTVQISDEANRLHLIRPDELPESVLQNIEKQLGLLREAKETAMRASFMSNTGSIQNFLINALEGKVEDAVRTTWQLSGMLYGTNGYTDMETKAIDRESGKILAEYIAKNYFDNEEEAKSFIDTINKYAELSEMKDKGYIVSDNTLDRTPYKPHPENAKTSLERLQQMIAREMEFSRKIGTVNVNTDYEKWKKKWGETDWDTLSADYESLRNFLCNADGYEDFYGSIAILNCEKNRAFYAAWDANEKAVQAIIDGAKASMSNVTVDSDFLSKYYLELLQKKSV